MRICHVFVHVNFIPALFFELKCYRHRQFDCIFFFHRIVYTLIMNTFKTTLIMNTFKPHFQILLFVSMNNGIMV